MRGWRRRRRLGLAGWLPAVLLVLSCSAAVPARSTPVLERAGARLVSGPAGTALFDAAWLPGGSQLVAAMATLTPDGRTVHLYRVALDGAELQRLPLPDEPNCRRTGQRLPRVLGDGRIAFVQSCEGNLDPARPMPQETNHLQVFDPATGAVRRLVPYPLPLWPRHFDFAPDGRLGIINDGRGLYEALQWLRPDRLERTDLPLERAGALRWSPDGGRIAVGGIPKAPGNDREGLARLDLPWQLLVWSLDTGELRVLADGLRYVATPSWSPDGRRLAVSLQLADGDAGLYLVEVESGRRTKLLDGEDLGAANWSPDGRRLAVTLNKSEVDLRKEGGAFGILLIEAPAE